METAPRDGTPIWVLEEPSLLETDWERVYRVPCPHLVAWNPEGDSWADENGVACAAGCGTIQITGTWSTVRDVGGWLQPNEVIGWRPCLKPGAEIRRIRKERRWTQKLLALVLGMTQSALSRVEADAHSPSVRTLEEFADALNCTLEVTFVPKPSGILWEKPAPDGVEQRGSTSTTDGDAVPGMNQ